MAFAGSPLALATVAVFSIVRITVGWSSPMFLARMSFTRSRLARQSGED